MRIKATGIITGFQHHRRYISVFVSYHTKEGIATTGTHDITAIGAIGLTRNKNKEVKITYSKRNPHKVHIVSSKMGYIVGLIFLAIATLFLYSMFFNL